MSIQKVFLYENGQSMSIFSDHTVLSISSKRDTFIYTNKQAKSEEQQMTMFCKSHQRGKVMQTLSYTNQHIDATYKLFSFLSDEERDSCFWRKELIGQCQWQLQSERKKLWHVGNDGEIILESIDGLSRIILAGNGKLIHLTFPVQVLFSDKELSHDPLKEKFLYCFQDQFYSVHKYPSRWHYVVGLILMAYCEVYESNHTPFEEDLSAFQLYSSALPPSLPIYSENENADPKQIHHYLPKISDEQSQFIHNNHTNIYQEFTKNYTYKFIPPNLVEILCHHDNSVLIFLDNQIIHYQYNFNRKKPVEKAYSNDFLPETVYMFDRIQEEFGIEKKMLQIVTRKVEFKKLANYGFEFKERAMKLQRHLALTEGPTNFQSKDSQTPKHNVRETNFIENVGKFTFYSDERTSVRFVDRTLLTIYPNGICNLITAQGKVIKFSLDNIMAEYREYLEYAMEFRSFAILQDAEKLVLMEEQRQTEQLLRLQHEHSQKMETTLTLLQSDETD